MTWPELRRDVVIMSGAISGGIHAALVREHLGESAASGGGFIAATVLLAVVTVALTYRPGSTALAAAALVFAGLLASYALAVTSGVPLLHPDTERVDGLALFTKAVELIGLAVALDLIRSGGARLPFAVIRTEGVRA